MENRKFVWIGAALVGSLLWKSYRQKWLAVARRRSQTVSDKAGNYDIDGVSYDPELGRVVVASDGSVPAKPRPSQHLA